MNIYGYPFVWASRGFGIYDELFFWWEGGAGREGNGRETRTVTPMGCRWLFSDIHYCSLSIVYVDFFLKRI